MKPSKIKIEWYNEMYYGKNKNHAAEIMGSKVLYDKSPEYIAGFCQAKADQGFGVSINNEPIHGLLAN
ncbi:MAG: hypothetical protein Tp152DCM46671_66 [Prokaryotic dsDNA virus sp.]|nr:MAG: hypothetical protein Tp152DCM46671_66 [Prokaryotic dsDNA virus sp.]